LLTRFYDPGSGQILLDGEDLRDYKLTDLRDQFAIVLQEPVLFSTSTLKTSPTHVLVPAGGHTTSGALCQCS
jgi:ABC-type transport system involved in Fe-S cluster assembly fused permease/ATPase subunit